MSERYAATADIRAAVKGRETEVLDLIVAGWRDGKPHIRCPYPDHADNNPSWRWDKRKARAFCTCIERSNSIFDVVAKVEGVDFEAAKIRVAELLKRPDLIRVRGTKQRGRGKGGTIPPKQLRNRATPSPNANNSEGLTVARGDATPDNTATPPGCTLAALAEAKKLPLPFLQSVGLRDVSYCGAPAIRIPYFAGERGEEPAIRFRVALDGPDRFRWKRGSKARLYGARDAWALKEAGYAVLVEGETDCLTLWHAGFPALGLPGATNWNEERDAPLFDGVATIYAMVEPDQGGPQMLAWLAKSRIRDRVRLVRLDGFKDPSALHLDNPERFCERWQAALEAAEPYQAIAERESAAQADEARAAAGDLLSEDDLLGCLVEDVHKAGLVGEDRNAKILYLALTTRLFDRPVSVAVKGVSSGGKSHTVETALNFFPPSACWARTAMSDRALAYSEEDFRHRHLVLYEAAGATSDTASYLIRSLLSEGRIRYEMVEKTKDGMRPRLIEKDGPTGLIVTTTATRLHPENETRLLSLTVADTPAQTAAVLLALAQPGRGGTPDYTPWLALQKWLEGGERRVDVPFAARLAEKIPPLAVRLRRDFVQLLALIRAHALLHRERRARDERGRIVATLADYAAVRELVADAFAEGLEATVKPATRETVAAVKDLLKALDKDEVMVAEIEGPEARQERRESPRPGCGIGRLSDQSRGQEGAAGTHRHR